MDWITALSAVAAWVTANNWPIVVLAGALIFKNELCGLAKSFVTMSERVTRIAGVELQSQYNDQGSPLADTEAMFDLKSIDVLDNDTSLKPFYEHFAQLIDEKSINQQERFPRAVRAWAYTARARVFDAIARTSFETQIAALRSLSSKPTDKRGLRQFHDEYVKRARLNGFSETAIGDFEDWVAFLLSKELVTRGERGRYAVSNLGTAFLWHLDHESPPNSIEL